ncbi:hypothetical protein XENOCAPTIV_020694 [Xenoophorus captivus]|uniref:Uncharacterized protein n=1 Tax=Xenoophorus captivus TaxID=1517983 RepID=A0ABV0QTN8_9TELE
MNLASSSLLKTINCAPVIRCCWVLCRFILDSLSPLPSREVTLVFKGNVTFACAETVSVAVTFPGPQSFLQFPWTTLSSSGSMLIGFQFRTWNKAGLLLTFDLPQQVGVAWLFLSEARLRLQIQKGGRVLLELSAGKLKATSELQFNQWLSQHNGSMS